MTPPFPIFPPPPHRPLHPNSPYTPTPLTLTVVTVDGGRTLTITKDELEGENDFALFIRCIIQNKNAVIVAAAARTVLFHTLLRGSEGKTSIIFLPPCQRADNLGDDSLQTDWQTHMQRKIKAKEENRESNETVEARENKWGSLAPLYFTLARAPAQLHAGLSFTLHSTIKALRLN